MKLRNFYLNRARSANETHFKEKGNFEFALPLD